MKKLLLFLLLASTGFSADWYVRTDGNDSNDGSADTSGDAKLTVQGAFDIGTLAAGDTIHVGAGTFTGDFETTVAGTDGNPITLVGTGIATTNIDGTLELAHDWHTLSDFSVVGRVYVGDEGPDTGSSDCILQNLDISRSNYIIRLYNGSDRLLVSNCDLHHIQGASYGMIASSTSTGVIIENNTFRDNNGEDCMRLNGASSWTIRDNLFTDCRTASSYHSTSTTSHTIGTGEKTFTVSADMSYEVGDQIGVTDQATTANYMEGLLTAVDGLDITIDVVTQAGSGTISSWYVTAGIDVPHDGGGGNHGDILQSWLTPTKDIVFERNWIEDSTCQLGNLKLQAGETVSESGNWQIRNNVFVNSRIQLNSYYPNIYVYNNSIFGTGGFLTGFDEKSDANNDSPSLTVTNNIFCRVSSLEGGTGAYDSGATADYNLLTDVDDSDFSTLPAESNGINGGYTPAQIFVNSGSDDFTLITGSPAINAGTTIGAFSDDYNEASRPVGAAWDMGAYEYGSGATFPANHTGPTGRSPSIGITGGGTTLTGGYSIGN